MTRPKPKVTVVGSLNIDMVSRAPRYPQQGETLIGDAFDIFTGGKGFNQATAASRLGADVTLIGCVGTDVFGEMLLSAVAAEQIQGRVKRDEVGTGVATIVVEPNGENSIIVVPRANMALTPADIEASAACIAAADVLLLQLETPIAASERAAAIAQANGTAVLLNPAPAQPLAAGFLAHVDIIIPNQSEAALLTGMPVTNAEEAVSAAHRLMNAETAATPVVARGPAPRNASLVNTEIPAVVLTLGERGALLLTPEMSEAIPALPVDVVDTTGAGDAFCGALATALASGESLREAVRFANAAGAAAVTTLGATPSMPTREHLKNLTIVEK